MTIERRVATLEAQAAATADTLHIICTEDGDVFMGPQLADESDEAFRHRVEAFALEAARQRHSDVAPAFTSAPWLTKPSPTSVAEATERNTDV